jgi:hypothetical protein
MARTPAQDPKWRVWRDAIWDRDGGRSRASGAVLERQSIDDKRRGECAHLIARSVDPAHKLEPWAGVLLSAEEHRLSDPRTAGAVGKRLLLIEPADPGGELRGDRELTFIRVDRHGRELWRNTSGPVVGDAS